MQARRSSIPPAFSTPIRRTISEQSKLAGEVPSNDDEGAPAGFGIANGDWIMTYINKGLAIVGQTDRLSLTLMRIAIAIVFLWIGALKFVPYEADSITPFVANSPFLSYFYKYPEQYKAHLTHEGQLVPEQRAWQQENHTYAFSTGLGIVELTIGTLVLLGTVSPVIGFIGALLAFGTPFVTLSFLITTPEAWVQPLGDAQFGFPFLSGGGRLVLKDTVILAGALLVMADSARSLLRHFQGKDSSKQLTSSTPTSVILASKRFQ
jgi:reactive chlorine resistance protein C